MFIPDLASPAKVCKSHRWVPISCISRYPSPICPWEIAQYLIAQRFKKKFSRASEAFKRILFVSFSFLKSEFGTNWKKVKKQKDFWACRNGQTERSGSESRRIQSQEGQELGSPSAAPTLISQTSGVTHSVDLTNQGLGNHYLRDVQDVFTLQQEDSISDILLRLDI